jgi:DNA-binding response OmpR family regulator
MTGIFFHILDAPLREALLEQVAASKLGVARIADTLPALLKQTEGISPCVIVIDMGAQDKKLAAALREMHQRQDRPATLALGDGGDNENVTESFTKPLRLGHLIARIRYYLETAPLLRDKPFSFGPYRLEPQNRCVASMRDNEIIRLTEKETALLSFLARTPQPASRRDILAEVWGYDERIDTHTLETHIYQLRRKLDNGKEGGENWLIFESGAYRLARGQE